MTFDEITAQLENKDALQTMRRWLARGDGIALYQNAALDSSMYGHCKWVSYGSATAQLPGDRPPQRLPDIGNTVNWAYQLSGVCRGGG